MEALLWEVQYAKNPQEKFALAEIVNFETFDAQVISVTRDLDKDGSNQFSYTLLVIGYAYTQSRLHEIQKRFSFGKLFLWPPEKQKEAYDYIYNGKVVLPHNRRL